MQGRALLEISVVWSRSAFQQEQHHIGVVVACRHMQRLVTARRLDCCDVGAFVEQDCGNAHVAP
jgi:hypothetical protein